MFNPERAEQKFEKSDTPAAEAHFDTVDQEVEAAQGVDDALVALEKLLSEVNNDYIEKLNDPKAKETELTLLTEQLEFLRGKIDELKKQKEGFSEVTDFPSEGGRAPQD